MLKSDKFAHDTYVHKPSKKKHLFTLLKEQKITHVNLGFREFKIIVRKDLSYKDGTKLDGLTQFGDYEIFIEEDLSDDRARETLTHEIFHCILDILELDEKGKANFKMTNEILTSLLTRGFLLFKRLNPSLAKLLS